jgi:hypothetical protein
MVRSHGCPKEQQKDARMTLPDDDPARRPPPPRPSFGIMMAALLALIVAIPLLIWWLWSGDMVPSVSFVPDGPETGGAIDPAQPLAEEGLPEEGLIDGVTE